MSGARDLIGRDDVALGLAEADVFHNTGPYKIFGEVDVTLSLKPSGEAGGAPRRLYGSVVLVVAGVLAAAIAGWLLTD